MSWRTAALAPRDAQAKAANCFRQCPGDHDSAAEIWKTLSFSGPRTRRCACLASRTCACGWSAPTGDGEALAGALPPAVELVGGALLRRRLALLGRHLEPLPASLRLRGGRRTRAACRRLRRHLLLLAGAAAAAAQPHHQMNRRAFPHTPPSVLHWLAPACESHAPRVDANGAAHFPLHVLEVHLPRTHTNGDNLLVLDDSAEPPGCKRTNRSVKKRKNKSQQDHNDSHPWEVQCAENGGEAER